MLAVVAVLAGACSSSGGSDSGAPVKLIGPSQPGDGGSTGSASGGSFNGDTLGKPVELTAADRTAQFSSSAGGTTTLGDLQQGKLMLLYFGYTHCPDVCPTTLADLGQALRKLPAQVQAHTQVVFVTADPDRDTPAVMKAWLSHFDQSLVNPYIGLTANVKQIDTVATTMGIPLEPPVKQSNGSVTVQHGAQTLAFLNDRSTLLWTSGTTPEQYGHDVTLLLTKEGGK